MRRWLSVFLIALCAAVPGGAQQSADAPSSAALDILEIPRRDRVRLARELLGVDTVAVPRAEPVAYVVGDRRIFSVNDNASNTATPVEAELVALGQHIAIWVDTRANANPDLAQFLIREFDTLIYPKLRGLWGAERTPGIDADPRVVALFTYGVGPGTAAYYASEHSLPRTVAPDSNEAEMMIYNIEAYGVNFESPDIYSVTAHEFQHMIRDNIDANAPSWVNEGLSVFTEWLIGYVPTGYVFAEYLFQPRTQLTTWASSGAHYGTAGLFMTYFYQRFGPAGMAALSQADGLGMALVDNALRDAGAVVDADAVFADWVAANWLQAGGTVWGYRDLELFEPASRVVSLYPATVERRTPPYATDYIKLRDLPPGATLRLDVAIDDFVPLLPDDAASAPRMWAAIRHDDSAPALVRAFDLRSVESASLDYRVWFDLERAYDYAYLTVSVDGGETWDVLETSAMDDGSLYGPGYSARSDGWLDQSVSLDAYAGREILVRFLVVTDDSLNSPGLAIDDVRLDAVGYASDFDVDDGGWDGQGWLLTDNRLPARAWVQVLQQRPGGPDVQRILVDADGASLAVRIYDDAESVALAVSPLAPVTTEYIGYAVTVTTE
jgi:immune inhibitor A